MPKVLYRADIATVAGGITMHEAECCCVPAIAVCQSIDHQLLVAGWLQDAGCVLNLGYGDSLRAGEIATAVRRLAQDRAVRQSMSDAGPRVCDSRGSQRTAEAILVRWQAQ
jgi:spore coat polysaccharide biosynthesis predicted glycosyltransferase SpsG